MTETELIDVVNERIAQEPSFGMKFQRAVATKNVSQIRSLIAAVVDDSDHDISELAVDRVAQWFAA